MALKHKHIRAVATEESLDDWHAQSLGIPYEKFVRQKKMLASLMNAEKKPKDMNNPLKKRSIPDMNKMI